MTGSFGQFNGLQLYANPSLVVPGEPVEVVRSWRERLFTRPWRPWVATKSYRPMVPDPNLYKHGDKVAGHPVTLASLKLMEENLNG